MLQECRISSDMLWACYENSSYLYCVDIRPLAATDHHIHHCIFFRQKNFSMPDSLPAQILLAKYPLKNRTIQAFIKDIPV